MIDIDILSNYWCYYLTGFSSNYGIVNFTILLYYNREAEHLNGYLKYLYILEHV
jgi:hypothetical protein